MPGFFQLEGRAARRLAGEFQARDAHRPHGAIAWIGQADEDLAAGAEGQQQARQRRVLAQAAGLHQRAAQRLLELAAEGREFLAVVGVEHFQPQAAAHRVGRQLFQQHADAVLLGQFDEAGAACPLAREDQLGKAQALHQAVGAVGILADEFGMGGGRPGLGVAGNVQARGVFGQFGADLVLEARPAMQ
ncbi:hypothetical protein D9M73_193150 [compost metagenome]